MACDVFGVLSSQYCRVPLVLPPHRVAWGMRQLALQREHDVLLQLPGDAALEGAHAVHPREAVRARVVPCAQQRASRTRRTIHTARDRATRTLRAHAPVQCTTTISSDPHKRVELVRLMKEADEESWLHVAMHARSYSSCP